MARSETGLERTMRFAFAGLRVRAIAQYTGFRYARPDFYLPELRVVVEADGAHWHNRPVQKRRDRQKDAYYKSLGLRVARLTESEIRTDPLAAARRAMKGPWQ